jgi:uncharacterized protein
MARLPAFILALLVIPAAQGCSRGEPANRYPQPPDGPVLDLADILPAEDEATLGRHLRAYFNATGNALVVVSVVSLDGETIEHYATGLFNQWGIGDARTGHGLLVLVAPAERRVRIEVGCGLEAALPNDAAGAVIARDMLPRYRSGDLRGGTLAGVASLEQRLASARATGPTSPACTHMMKEAA